MENMTVKQVIEMAKKDIEGMMEKEKVEAQAKLDFYIAWWGQYADINARVANDLVTADINARLAAAEAAAAAAAARRAELEAELNMWKSKEQQRKEANRLAQARCRAKRCFNCVRCAERVPEREWADSDVERKLCASCQFLV
jgi:hypothetical protein